MIPWSTELQDLQKYLIEIKGKIQGLEKELNSLLNASEEVTALIFARRSLEVMVTDICENKLNRPRGTDPLQGIIDRFAREKLISDSIHTSMSNLIRISNYGAHPKDFDPRQVRGALIDLSIVLEWFITSKEPNTKIIENQNSQQIPSEEPIIANNPNNLINPSKQQLRALELLSKAMSYVLSSKYNEALELLNTANLLDENNQDIIQLIEKIKSELEQNRLAHQNKVIEDSITNDNKIPVDIRSGSDTYEFQKFIDPRDEHEYKIVTIGSQCWFAENLAYMTHLGYLEDQSGVWIYDFLGNDLKEAKESDNYRQFGCLYNWLSVYEKIYPISPPGWHIPTINEWRKLIKFLGGETKAGEKLKLNEAFAWDTLSDSMANKSKFSAVAGGLRNVDGDYCNKKKYGNWWTATCYDEHYAWSCYLSDTDCQIRFHRPKIEYGFSIRCVKD